MNLAGTKIVPIIFNLSLDFHHPSSWVVSTLGFIIIAYDKLNAITSAGLSHLNCIEMNQLAQSILFSMHGEDIAQLWMMILSNICAYLHILSLTLVLSTRERTRVRG